MILQKLTPLPPIKKPPKNYPLRQKKPPTSIILTTNPKNELLENTDQLPESPWSRPFYVCSISTCEKDLGAT